MCSINHEKKALFIHVPKTGGTYIRENLEKYYGFKYFQIKRDDHHTLVNDFEIQKNIINNHYSGNRIYGIIEYFKNTAHSRNIGIFEYSQDSDYLNKKTDMTSDKWKSYYKFCFIRNPYERLISGYNYCMKYLKIDINFETFIDNQEYLTDFEYMHTITPQSKHMYYKNQKIIDSVCKFENIEEDFKKILLKIGFKENEIIHDKNKKNNNPHKDIKYYIKNQEILNKVNSILKDDFIKLNFNKIEKINNLLY